jgi:hypothetical protein
MLEFAFKVALGMSLPLIENLRKIPRQADSRTQEADADRQGSAYLRRS